MEETKITILIIYLNFFEDVTLIDITLWIIFTIISGVGSFLINKTMNDFTFYHIIIPMKIGDFIKNMIDSFDIILLIFFIVEFLFYLIFLEIIELNFCDLNKNIKKNIQIRAKSDSTNEEGRDSFFDLDEDNDEENNDINIQEELPNY